MKNNSFYSLLSPARLWWLLAAAWLFTLSFIVDNYWSSASSPANLSEKLSRYIQSAERDFLLLTSDSLVQQQIQEKKLTENKLRALLSKPYFITVTDQQNKSIFWNTQVVSPDSLILQSPETAGFSKLQNGYYAWYKKVVGHFTYIALIPVKWNFIVTNEYLKNDFALNDVPSFLYDISADTSKGAIVRGINKQKFFSVVELHASTGFKNNEVSIWLRIVACFIILMQIHLIATSLVHSKGLIFATSFLAGTLLLLRSLSYTLPVPLNFHQFELFSSLVYGSGPVHRSLGDLLMNVLVALWVAAFARYHLVSKGKLPEFKHASFSLAIVGLGLILVLVATFTASNLVRSLVFDSQISFDVINFFSLSAYSVVGFFILCGIAIVHYLITQSVFILVKKYFPYPFYYFLFALIVVGLLYLSFNIGSLYYTYELCLLGWLILVMLILNSSRIRNITSVFITSRLVFWIFVYSASIAAVVIMENNRKEILNRQHYAEVLSAKSDPTGETLLRTMLTDFRADYLADNFYRFYNQQIGQAFKDSLINNNISGYINKFETQIFVYGDKEEPIYNAEPLSYNYLNSIVQTQAKPTNVPGLYYFDESLDQYTYISKKTIVDIEDDLIGYVFILVHPKITRSEQITPELFDKGINNSIENTTTYAFAVYNQGKLVKSHNEYPFSTSAPGHFFAGNRFLQITNNNHSELWYNAGNGKIVVIVKEKDLLIESITLFSYMFFGFLLLSAVLYIFSMLYRSRLRAPVLWHLLKFNLRNQIYGTIISFSILSFLIIGIATILFFISRYENNNREQLSNTIRLMGAELQNSAHTDTTQEGIYNFQNAVRTISEIHGVDANLYDTNGNLRVSSLPLPYTKGIISRKMDPAAYYYLHENKRAQFFQKEKIGGLSYLSNYAPILDSVGNATSYLNIPYFTSQTKLKQEISNFLVTIINLNAFIFLIAGIVALIITNRITNSFSIIGQKMKQLHLGSLNERIQWNRNDEIGQLVNEYNKMVNKLDESAITLAKTEREGAWREMARQVAHEIKNPLTPMKLSMQYLLKAVEADAPNIRELTQKVSSTLVEQIDHLSAIAGEFSQFANIENANKEKMDINESLRSIRSLHFGTSESSFTWEISENPVNIYADKTHINRLFTNLILNGLQAVPAERVARIKITEILGEQHVLIKISDNGSGITHEQREKIFTPNFTTKSSGTGLGLAMCKRIVEQINGEIYFETVPESGTTFFVRIPLYEIG